MPPPTAPIPVVRRLRAVLPPDAFLPNRRRTIEAVLHLAAVLVGVGMIRVAPATGPLATCRVGHSLLCLALIAHEASHRALALPAPARRWFCLVTLGLNLVPPTMWNRVHNDAHHQHAGTPSDPDRPFMTTEMSTATRWYSAVLYPHADTFIGPLVFVHFVAYLLRNVATVFYPAPHEPAIVPARPMYTRREQLTVASELVWIVLMQVGAWHLSGATWAQYVWIGPFAWMAASSLLMAYVFTNHFLNDLSHGADPLAGTTSVIVPRWVDRLHGHFSYHTEHHLFPTMNPDYYPLVSTWLSAHTADRYQRLPFREAWRRLWRRKPFQAPPA